MRNGLVIGAVAGIGALLVATVGACGGSDVVGYPRAR